MFEEGIFPYVTWVEKQTCASLGIVQAACDRAHEADSCHVPDL